MYKIEFTHKAQKQYYALNKDLQIRIAGVLNRISVRPSNFLERLSGVKYYKLRVGDYRLIIDLQTDRLIILVIKVGHRKNIYDNLN